MTNNNERISAIPMVAVGDKLAYDCDVSTCRACCSRKPQLLLKDWGYIYQCVCGMHAGYHENELLARQEWERLMEKIKGMDALIAALSPKELAMLNKIADDNYACYNWDERNRGQNRICTWAEVIIESKSDGGVFTQLQNKGLAWYQDNGSRRESYVGLTPLAYVMVYRMRGKMYDCLKPDDPILITDKEYDDAYR